MTLGKQEDSLDDFDFSVKHKFNNDSTSRESTTSLTQKLGMNKNEVKYNNTIAHSADQDDNPFLKFEKDTKDELTIKSKPLKRDSRVKSFILNNPLVGGLARPSSARQADFYHNKNSIDYILENEWQK